MSKPAGTEPSAQKSTGLVHLVAGDPLGGATGSELKKLRAQHQKLLGQVAKKRDAVEAAAEALRLQEQRLASQVGLLQEKIRLIRDEIRAEFEFLVGEQSHLAKKERNKVRRLMKELFDEDEMRDDAAEEELETPEEQPSAEAQPDRDARRSQGHRAAPQVRSASRIAAPAALLRTLFKRLALALHPDKVQDAGLKEQRNRLMQKVTGAYGRGDLAALLAIEQRWLPNEHEAAGLEPKSATTRLREANTELRRQLKSLGAELKALVKSGRASASTVAPGVAVDPLVVHLEKIHAEATRLREVARAFRAQEISVTQFVSAHYQRARR